MWRLINFVEDFFGLVASTLGFLAPAVSLATSVPQERTLTAETESDKLPEPPCKQLYGKLPEIWSGAYDQNSLSYYIGIDEEEAKRLFPSGEGLWLRKKVTDNGSKLDYLFFKSKWSKHNFDLVIVMNGEQVTSVYDINGEIFLLNKDVCVIWPYDLMFHIKKNNVNPLKSNFDIHELMPHVLRGVYVRSTEFRELYDTLFKQ